MPVAVERGNDIARADGLAIADFEVGGAGQQQTARPDRPADPLAGAARIAVEGNALIDEARIAIAQIVGHAGFGPEHQAGLVQLARHERSAVLANWVFVIRRIVEVFLADIGLDEGEGERAITRRAVVRHQHQQHG